LNNVPTDELFSAFHKSGINLALASSPPLSFPAAGAPTSTPDSVNQLMTFVAPFLGAFAGQAAVQQRSHIPAQHTIAPSPTKFAAPFGDVEDEVQYPEIREFFERLENKYPIRPFTLYEPRFTSQDFYHINEILALTSEQLTSSNFALSLGNATFLLKEVRAEVNRIRQQGRNAQA
jgi:hypothetical protein